MEKKIGFVEALAILVGTQIGAGILGLPYALKDLGILGIGLIFGVGFITLITAIVVLKLSEKSPKSLPELTADCFGNIGGIVMFLSISVLIYGAMIAYIASSGELLNSLFEIPSQYGSLIFWIMFSVVIFFGIKTSGKTEVALSFMLAFAMIGAVIMVSPQFKYSNLKVTSIKPIYSAIGVVAFAFVSHMLVPEIRISLRFPEKAKSVVIWGFVLPMIFYSIFSLAFLGSYGREVPEIVSTVLSQRGFTGKLLGVLLPLAAISTSYIGVGYAQMKNFERCLKTPHMLSWIFTTVPPMVIYLAGLKSFVKALWIGGTFGGIIYAGILPAMMYFKCFKGKSYLMNVLVSLSVVVFAISIIGSIF